MAQIGNVEIDLSNGGWGGDFSLTDDGDLVLAVDSVTDPAATLQRMARLLLTNAYIALGDGTPISEGDDIYNDWYGASIRASLGEMITPTLLATIKSHILAAIATDNGILQNPAPVVTVLAGPNNSILISGEVWLVTGQSSPLPSIVLPVSGPPIINQTAIA